MERGQYRMPYRNGLTTRTEKEHYPGAAFKDNYRATRSPKAIQRPNRTGSKRLPTKPSRACGGDARQAVKALLVTTEFLETQIAERQASVSNGYARGIFEPVPRDRKDWYD
jgi:hypothetical protein